MGSENRRSLSASVRFLATRKLRVEFLRYFLQNEHITDWSGPDHDPTALFHWPQAPTYLQLLPL